MKEYFVLTILNDTLIFNYRILNNNELKYVNKNCFFNNSLYYDLKYYKMHLKLIVNNLKGSLVNTIKILRIVSFKFPVYLISKLKISNVVLEFSSTLSLSDYDLFLDNKKYIKNIYCYYMPNKIRLSFRKSGIEIFTLNNIKISEYFLKQQNSENIDDLYSKKVIKINEEYPGIVDDIKEFLKINYNLKAIHIYTYSKSLIEAIVNSIKDDESRNVIVYLHQGYDKGDFIVGNFDWLKKISDCSRSNGICEFRIIYANSFLGSNLFKQLTFNNLKLASILCIYVCVVSLIIVKSYDYIEELNVQQLRNKIMTDAVNSVNDDNQEEELLEEEQDYQQEIEEGMEDANKLTKKEVKSRYSFDIDIKALKKINKETKAYIVVKNTNISYPVVQHSDNSYYLKYDIYKRKTSIGWIFFDYRNNIKNFDDNTIIYGHSMLNGTMFGTLKKTLNASWRENKDNLIINLTTEKETLKFKIFSIYKVDYTTDYLKVKFDSDSEKEDFIKMISKRSSYKFDTKVGLNDKILTLSTCTGGNNRRLVVHAVLLKE